MNLKKIILSGIAIIAVIIIFNKCLGESPEEKEERNQIDNVEFMVNYPTYYVDGVEFEEGVYNIDLHRQIKTPDGTIPDSVTVNFYEDMTPSAQYLHKGDSIKVTISVVKDESRIDGRYIETKTYNADLFIFVDQISNLQQKYKKKYGL